MKKIIVYFLLLTLLITLPFTASAQKYYLSTPSGAQISSDFDITSYQNITLAQFYGKMTLSWYAQSVPLIRFTNISLFIQLFDDTEKKLMSTSFNSTDTLDFVGDYVEIQFEIAYDINEILNSSQIDSVILKSEIIFQEEKSNVVINSVTSPIFEIDTISIDYSMIKDYYNPNPSTPSSFEPEPITSTPSINFPLIITYTIAIVSVIIFISWVINKMNKDEKVAKPIKSVVIKKSTSKFKTCPTCGKVVHPSDLFCMDCGTKL